MQAAYACLRHVLSLGVRALYVIRCFGTSHSRGVDLLFQATGRRQTVMKYTTMKGLKMA